MDNIMVIVSCRWLKLAPALPPLFVLADEGARSLTGPRAKRALAAALVIAVVFSGWSHLALSDTRNQYAAGLERAHVALGKWLAQSQPDGTWVALGDAGAIAFWSGLPVIDLWGLADATIARLPGEYGNRAFLWPFYDAFRELAFDSPVGEIAATMMGSLQVSP